MKVLPDGVLFKHRDEEAEAVQDYAKSKEGVENTRERLRQVKMHYKN